MSEVLADPIGDMWNPGQYERFKAERSQPFRDLLAMVDRRDGMRVLDLGCGTGELTRELHDGLGATKTVGVDNSETMLGKAAAFAGNGVRFEHRDIESFVAEGPFDLIFSNAALHWVRDHPALLKRLWGFLAPDGQIAIGMPANDDHPSHATAAEVATAFGVEPRHDPLLPIDEYARLLYALGFKRPLVRMQVYGHELESSAAVIEWVKGTLLTDYEKRLGERFPDFMARYSAELLPRLGTAKPFFYTYKRLLILGKDRVEGEHQGHRREHHDAEQEGHRER
ncbi:MAG: trans-aconitate 2-methyltransferase [Thermoanaerobaculia bacterium]